MMDERAKNDWLKSRPHFASDVLARRVVMRGKPTIVMQHPATGRHWRSTVPLYQLVQLLDGSRSVSEALAIAGLAGSHEQTATLLRGLASMAAAGLLHAPGLRRAGTGPVDTRLRDLAARTIFMRVPMGDLGVVMPAAMPMLGWLYSRGGTVILLGFVSASAWTLAGEGPAIAAQMERLSDAGPSLLVIGWLLFAASKMLHEIGHAVATRRVGAMEGLDLRSFRWGVSVMFLMPAPYVDVSSAWLIASRWRRCQVGLAGIQIDLFVASLATLAWAEIGQGSVADRLFELILLCGVSSILFNANPLVRLDGYYVLSDLLELPNLQSRGWLALRNMLLWPLGLGARPSAPSDIYLALYSAASWIWRWGVLIAVFWLAGGISPTLAFAFAIIVGSLYVAIPFARGFCIWLSLVRTASRRSLLAPIAICVLVAALCFIPMPVHVVSEGIVWNEGVTLVYAPADGLIRAVASQGARGTVVQLDNPELLRTLGQLQAEGEALDIQARRARMDTPSKVDAISERQRAVASQKVAIGTEIANWNVVLPETAVWQPLRADALMSSWVRRDDPRPLGMAVAGGPIVLRIVLNQWDGPAVLSELAKLHGSIIPVRRRGEERASLQAVVLQLPNQARDELPSPALSSAAGGQIATKTDARGVARPTERLFEIQLALTGIPAAPPLQHGARVEAMIRLPSASLLEIGLRRLRQALQHHLKV